MLNWLLILILCFPSSFCSSLFNKRKRDIPSLTFPTIPTINSKQWYLKNTRHPGYDLNVLDVWKMGITGKGIVIALIDDGVDGNHQDLKGKYVSSILILYQKNTNN